MPEIPHIVEQIVDHCHVGKSDSDVIRYFISRFKRGRKTWMKYDRATRKQWLRWVLTTHRGNQTLYNAVMSRGPRVICGL